MPRQSSLPEASGRWISSQELKLDLYQRTTVFGVAPDTSKLWTVTPSL